MGGANSGRYGGKAKCESCPWIDVRVWARKGVLENGTRFTATWSGEREIGVHVSANRISLSYAYNGGVMSVHPVRLTYTDCNYGGQRAWFNCPCCGSRNAKLFLRSGRFACRTCNRLAYRSQAVDPVQRQHIAYKRVQALLNDGELKPKGMHWRTFERLHDRLNRIDQKMNAAFNLVAARLFERAGLEFAF